MSANPYQHELTWSQQEQMPEDDKFAYNEFTGSYLLTSAGCFDRHNIPRHEEQYNEEYWHHFGDWEIPKNREEYKEIRLIYIISQLLEKGYVPRETEELEDFVLRCFVEEHN